MIEPDITHHAEVVALLGKRVRVKLAESAISEGIFLGFGQGGDVEIQEDDMMVHYCWPMLAIEEVSTGDKASS